MSEWANEDSNRKQSIIVLGIFSRHKSTCLIFEPQISDRDFGNDTIIPHSKAGSIFYFCKRTFNQFLPFQGPVCIYYPNRACMFSGWYFKEQEIEKGKEVSLVESYSFVLFGHLSQAVFVYGLLKNVCHLEKTLLITSYVQRMI
jgi:hypothetical protein